VHKLVFPQVFYKVVFAIFGLVFVLPIIAIFVKIILGIAIEYIVLDLYFLGLLAFVTGLAKLFVFVFGRAFGKSRKNFLFFWVLFVFGIALAYGVFAIEPSGYNTFSPLFYAWNSVDGIRLEARLLYFVLLGVCVSELFFVLISFRVLLGKANTKPIAVDFNDKLYGIISIFDLVAVAVGLLIKILVGVANYAIKLDLIVLSCIFCLYFAFVLFFVLLFGFKCIKSFKLSVFFIPLVFLILGFVLVWLPFDFLSFRLSYLVLSAVNLCVLTTYILNNKFGIKSLL